MLTPRSRVLLEKLTCSQLVKNCLSFMEPEFSYCFYKCSPFVPVLARYQRISPGPRLSLWMVRNILGFYGEELLAPHTSAKLDDHPLSALRDYFFNLFAATLYYGGRFSIRKLRTRHAVLTGTPLIIGASLTIDFYLVMGSRWVGLYSYALCTPISLHNMLRDNFPCFTLPY